MPGGILILLLTIPLAFAVGEPPRVSASVHNAQYDGDAQEWILGTCIVWTLATVGDGYVLIVDGTEYAVTPAPVPFRPGYLKPDVDCLDLTAPSPNETITIAVAATSGGTVIAQSCVVTINPTIYYQGVGQAESCGVPAFSPELRLTGTSETSGSDVTFRLNHTLSSRNASGYFYQLKPFGSPVWLDIEPASSFTSGAANLTVTASPGGYRLANFTFPGVAAEAGTSAVLWRVRAHDSLTRETSPWSCDIGLKVPDSIGSSCRRISRPDIIEDGPSLPFVNVTRLGDAFGIGATGAGLVLSGLISILLGAIMAAAGRNIESVVAGSSLGTAIGFLFGLTPGWIVLIVFFVSALLISGWLLEGRGE